MSNNSFLVIVILSLLAGTYIHEGVGWLVFALGIGFVMYLKRLDRVRKENQQPVTKGKDAF